MVPMTLERPKPQLPGGTSPRRWPSVTGSRSTGRKPPQSRARSVCSRRWSRSGLVLWPECGKNPGESRGFTWDFYGISMGKMAVLWFFF